ncbi:MAG: DUF2852 domain-containing protein, partial [Hyphomicrobium sp.]
MEVSARAIIALASLRQLSSELERIGPGDSRLPRLPPRHAVLGGVGGRAPSEHAPVGNRAFDEYRDETLQRVDEERHQFGDFLDRLR